jgi:hypothetical protein
MKINKTDTLRILVAEGNYKKALHIVKEFRGIATEDINKLKLAYECLVHNTEAAITEGIEILKHLYGQNE